MPDRDIVNYTAKVCIDFQEASARAYAEARMWIDGSDRYRPRVIAQQNNAAMLAREAQIRLSQLIGA